MDRVRLGCVKYLNTLPLIAGLSAWRDGEIISAVPARLIDMLLAREVDIALGSVIDAARHADRVRLLPVGMIGCDGPTLTVRLFSRVPIDRLSNTSRIAIDTDSHTSAALLQVVLWERHGVRPIVVDFDARERMVLPSAECPRPPASPTCYAAELGGFEHGDLSAACDAVLLIGDKVVTDPPARDEFPHELDLGQAWKELTGLPFVYAVWMCRAGEESSIAVQAAAAVLDRARRHNQMRLGWVVATNAEDRGWSADLAAKYVGTLLKYEVGEAERGAIAKFLAWSAELGLAPGAGVVWAEIGSG